MLKPSRFLASTSLSAALCLAACGGGAEVLLIPLFEFGFSGSSGGVPLQVFFVPDTPTTTSGNFDRVTFNVGATQFAYTGTYSGCNFTLDGSKSVPAPAAPSYNGRFVGNDSIQLTPTVASALPVLTLQRQGTGSRVIGC